MDPNDPHIDPKAFQEWLEDTAESEGASEYELLNRLMSSYWAINELSDLIEEPAFDDHSLPESRAERPGTGRADSTDGTASDAGEARNEILEVIEALKDWNENASAPQRDQTEFSIDPELLRLIEVLRSSPQTHPLHGSSNEYASDYRSQRDLEDLRDEVTDIAEQLEDLADGVNELERSVVALDDRHTRQIRKLATWTNRLKSRMGALATEESVDDLATRVDAVEAETTTRIDSLEAKFDETFESIRTILSYLVDKTNELVVATDVIVDSYDDAVRPALTDHAVGERVNELKEVAARHGVRTATCEYCDETVDIDLLTDPSCPQCEHRFGDLEARSSWWRTRHVLTIGGEEPRTIERIDDAIDARLGETETDGGDVPTDDFSWGERIDR